MWSELPLSKRYLTMLRCPSVTAECKAVCPNSSLNSRLAPLSNKACITDRWPCRAARCNGVFPSLLVASILAPSFNGKFFEKDSEIAKAQSHETFRRLFRHFNKRLIFFIRLGQVVHLVEGRLSNHAKI